MTMRGNDTEDRMHFRSDRITCENGLFFFATREGMLEGPYGTRDQAEVAAALFIREHRDPTKIASMMNGPDKHIYRYRQRSSDDRRGNDRRQGERRR